MNKKAGMYSSLLTFSIMYGLIIIIVYFTQLTTVRLEKLSDEVIGLLDYSKFGLFFNYDLLGYMFMALSTLFIGITLETKNKEEKILKKLLCIHGIFAIGCFVMPILGIFNQNMTGADIIGVIILEFWCIYFMPICILSYKYFKNK
jgi:cytochrome c biogenesis factor